MQLDLEIVVAESENEGFRALAVWPFGFEPVLVGFSAPTREDAAAGVRSVLVGMAEKAGIVSVCAHAPPYFEPAERVLTVIKARAANADPAANPIVDYMPPVIGSKEPWSASASKAHHDSERLIGTLLALAPLAAIADAYDANGLDEARPDWVEAGNETYDPQTELYCGRGGKALLTLQHALTAREVLNGTALGRLAPKTFHSQKLALKQIRTLVNSHGYANVIVSAIRDVLKELGS